jgi:formate-dependent nitrite reductase membrane component NrfD
MMSTLLDSLVVGCEALIGLVVYVLLAAWILDTENPFLRFVLSTVTAIIVSVFLGRALILFFGW